MEDLYTQLRQAGVDADIAEQVRAFREEHVAPQEHEQRIPATPLRYIGPKVWTEAIVALLAGQNILLAGPKATGKNVLAEDLAHLFGRPLWNASLHIDVDASTLIGSDTYADGRVQFRPGPITQCARVGGFGVLDEINMARNEALAVLHAALDFRRIIDIPGYELIRLDPACRFIATMNMGYIGTRALNEALASRFAIISMPTLDAAGLKKLLQTRFPSLTDRASEQLSLLFDEIRRKCAEGHLSDKALDLRGFLDSIALMEKGLDTRSALELCIVNKTFDSYERALINDVIDARLPKTRRLTLFAK
jgi:nitric oxide reductase NorQ protein